MKILVTGSRNWGVQHIEIIVRELSAFPKGTILVHGACLTGVDMIADVIGREMGFDVRPYPADWNGWRKKGKPLAAGPIRNREIVFSENLKDEPIDLCIAFHDNIAKSSGTKDMKEYAESVGLPVKLVEK